MLFILSLAARSGERAQRPAILAGCARLSLAGRAASAPTSTRCPGGPAPGPGPVKVALDRPRPPRRSQRRADAQQGH
eukprot:764651-Hanusia_phi.AAC.5